MADITASSIYRIMDLHESDRPRERLANLGPQALSNAELIAILLRVGVTGEKRCKWVNDCSINSVA